MNKGACFLQAAHKTQNTKPKIQEHFFAVPNPRSLFRAHSQLLLF